MVKSKKQRIRQKILDSLKEKVPLSTNRGILIPSSFKFYSKKDRRNSGRKYPKIIKPGMKYSEIIKQGLEPKEHWNDWVDYRDGQRDKCYYGYNNNIDITYKQCRQLKKQKIKKQRAIRDIRKKRN